MNLNNSYISMTSVIFSKDRPLQLELTLRSKKEFCKEDNYIYTNIIYKGSTDKYLEGYEILKKEYNNILFIEESEFKSNLINSVFDSTYVFFAVDDTIFTNPFSLSDIIFTLEGLSSSDRILGVSLRLGLNTVYCYPLSTFNKVPENLVFINSEIEKNYLSLYNWTTAGEGDFSYPLELSSSIYRTCDLYPIINGKNYNNPNELEWEMYNFATKNFTRKDILGMYKTSVAFSNPINKVQSVNNNRFWDKKEYTQEHLIEKFLDGYRIDLEPFRNFISNGCHQEVGLQYYKK
jgi:hypothetical protein